MNEQCESLSYTQCQGLPWLLSTLSPRFWLLGTGAATQGSWVAQRAEVCLHNHPPLPPLITSNCAPAVMEDSPYL